MEPAILLAVCGAYLVAGTVKGVIGLGLPPVSLGLLILVIDLPQAMAILIVPSLVTNIWQALAGGGAAALTRRLWPFLTAATLFVWVGGLALTRIDLPILSGLLGLALTVYALSGLAGLRLSLSTRGERWAGPLAGAINGTLAGMTGSFSVPGVLYLQALGLERDALVQAMGILFTVLTVALAISLGTSGLISGPLALASAAAILPALLGMVLGQHLRRLMPEPLFRKVFFASLLVLGLYITSTSLLG